MQYLKLIPIFCMLFMGCEKVEEKEELQCSSPPCSIYLDVWKDLIKERNGLSDYYIDAHFEIKSSEVIVHENGEQFVVKYIISIDWAEITMEDVFMVKISQHKDAYPDQQLTRGVYLKKDEIDALISYGDFDSYLSEIGPVYSLNFESATEALEAVRKEAKNPNLFFDRFDYKKSMKGYVANGHPYMFCKGIEDESTKIRMDGEIDLVSKNVSTYPTEFENKSQLTFGP